MVVLTVGSTLDLDVLYGLSHYLQPGYDKKRIHYGTAFLDGIKAKNYNSGMVTIAITGVETSGVKGIEQGQLSERHEYIDDFSFPTWNENGRLINMKLYSPEAEDLELINQLPHLQSLKIEGPALEDTLDLNLLADDLPLKAISTMWIKVKNTHQLCQFKGLEIVKLAASKVEGHLDTESCSKTIVVLNFSSTRFDNISVSSLPGLELMSLNESEILGEFELDGSSLANLKSLHMNEVEISSDLSRVELPSSLMQIYLRRTTDRDLTRLELPENLQYVDLRDAQLGDYTFLESAKNLTALNLWGSDFDQWSMLSQFTKLEHLNLNLTSLTTDDLAYLSEFNHLKTLSLGGTRVTNLEALADLQVLWKLNLYRSELRDLETVPSFQNLSSLILPLEEYHRNTAELPGHIQRMLQEAVSMGECREGQTCPEPPWAE